jgi:hypothetical protein
VGRYCGLHTSAIAVGLYHEDRYPIAEDVCQRSQSQSQSYGKTDGQSVYLGIDSRLELKTRCLLLFDSSAILVGRSVCRLGVCREGGFFIFLMTAFVTKTEVFK